ncbi:crossover junction endodeoxyribonuclease RuvC [Psychromonas sp. CNPT3]|uniref:crossover junction endodeoxyribonuclease RuvC n=1 Tax=Psychromonas sp. CNPT3 TaxID=314282 RepID=UPI00006E4847|nr:crossover junction endodeoxyribonuclease RuvC [Psychromonas sp. CNPT3]AGH81823.1 crossover junction endodeoxyribonuclease RuvC [Psychromonas sp. CNPT3]
MSIILGIDPGSRITGYGIIEQKGAKCIYIASGCIRTKGDTLAPKLDMIFSGISEIIKQYQPTEFAIEQVFMGKNPDSALKLGQARGAAIVAATQADLYICEYSARQIKQAVVGTGAATKDQVQQMVVRLLQLSGTPQADAADGLAVAICHAHTAQSLVAMAGKVKKTVRRRLC